MRLRNVVFGLSSLIIFSCNQSNNSATTAGGLTGEAALTVGKWRSETCFLADVSLSFQFVVQIKSSGELSQAFKKFDTADCTGPYSFVNPIDGSPTTTLIPAIQLEPVALEGAPANFVAMKTTNLDESGVDYVVMYVGDVPDTFHVFTEIPTNPGPEWSDWITAHPTLADFVTDPTDPMVENTIHFVPTADPRICSLEGTWQRCSQLDLSSSILITIAVAGETFSETIDNFNSNTTCSGMNDGSFSFAGSLKLGEENASTFIPNSTDADLTPDADLFGCGVGITAYTTLKFSESCGEFQIPTTQPSCSSMDRGTALEVAPFIKQ